MNEFKSEHSRLVICYLYIFLFQKKAENIFFCNRSRTKFSTHLGIENWKLYFNFCNRARFTKRKEFCEWIFYFIFFLISVWSFRRSNKLDFIPNDIKKLFFMHYQQKHFRFIRVQWFKANNVDTLRCITINLRHTQHDQSASSWNTIKINWDSICHCRSLAFLLHPIYHHRMVNRKFHFSKSLSWLSFASTSTTNFNAIKFYFYTSPNVEFIFHPQGNEIQEQQFINYRRPFLVSSENAFQYQGKSKCQHYL